jgi:hypothetical protein
MTKSNIKSKRVLKCCDILPNAIVPNDRFLLCLGENDPGQILVQVPTSFKTHFKLVHT